jgi:hypothetical protein
MEVGDEIEMSARIRYSYRGGRQVRLECQIEPRRLLLRFGQQTHPHRVAADGADRHRMNNGLSDVMLTEILHQTQDVNELVPIDVAVSGWLQDILIPSVFRA